MSDHVITATHENWERDIVHAPGVVAVYFWAPWCGHCKMFAPTFDEIAQEYRNKLTFAKVNCDENAAVATRCQIMGTPTLLIYRNGEVVDRIMGGLPKAQVAEKLDSLLSA